MVAFPFLKLPPESQQVTVKELEILELFYLSQCSKKTFKIVRLARQTAEDHLVLRIHLTNSRTVVILTPTNSNFQFDRTLAWNFYGRRNPLGLDLENPMPYKIHGVPGTIDLCLETEIFNEFGCASSVSTALLFRFIAQIRNLFSASVYSLRIYSERMDCLKGLMIMGALRNCHDFCLDPGRVSHEEMNMILERVRARNMTLLCFVDHGFITDKKVTATKLHIHSAKWINLANLDCKKADLTDCGLTNQDFNTFLRHWLDGSNRKLEYLLYSVEEKDNEANIELNLVQIVQGLPTIRGSPKRQDATSYGRMDNVPVQYESGLDLRRESDEMLATVMINQGRGDATFVFVVWHDPNPYLLPP